MMMNLLNFSLLFYMVMQLKVLIKYGTRHTFSHIYLLCTILLSMFSLVDVKFWDGVQCGVTYQGIGKLYTRSCLKEL